MPRQDAPVIRRIVRELVSPGETSVDPRRDGARILMLPGHGIRVAVATGGVQPAATHVITAAARRRIAVLPVQLLCRCLDEKGALLHVRAREARRPRNPVLHVAGAGAVHLET